MKLQGTHHYDHPRELVFQALLDPNVLSRTLPGCEELEQTAENEYSGKLKMKVGPVQGVFQGKVQLVDIDPPNGYRLELEGSGAPGFMNGSGNLRLTEAESGTELHYDIDAKVGGKIASIGQRLVESSAKVITRQGLSGLETQLSRLAEEQGTEAPQSSVAQSSAAQSSVAQSSEITSQATESEGATAPPAPVSSPADATADGLAEGPSQAEFAAEFAKGMVEELVPQRSRWVLVAAPLLLAAIAVAVYLRTCA